MELQVLPVRDASFPHIHVREEPRGRKRPPLSHTALRAPRLAGRFPSSSPPQLSGNTTSFMNARNVSLAREARICNSPGGFSPVMWQLPVPPPLWAGPTSAAGDGRGVQPAARPAADQRRDGRHRQAVARRAPQPIRGRGRARGHGGPPPRRPPTASALGGTSAGES